MKTDQEDVREGEHIIMAGAEMSSTGMKIKSSLIPRQPGWRLKSQFYGCASECRRLADVMVPDKDGRTIRVRTCEWRTRLCEINPRLFHAKLSYLGCTAQLVSLFCSQFSSIFSFLPTKIPINLEDCVKHKLKKNIPKRLIHSQARTACLWAKTPTAEEHFSPHISKAIGGFIIYMWWYRQMIQRAWRNLCTQASTPKACDFWPLRASWRVNYAPKYTEELEQQSCHLFQGGPCLFQQSKANPCSTRAATARLHRQNQREHAPS